MVAKDYSPLGNVGSMTLSYASETAPFTAPSGYDCTYAYNLNSAPVAITRRGDDEERRNVLVDDLALTYEGNRLVNVSDSGEEVLLEASGDFVDGATGSGEEYAYDANGNMVRDDNRGIRKIVYNCINQPSDIVVGKYENQKMHYDYAADGRKLATYASETMIHVGNRPGKGDFIRDSLGGSLNQGEISPGLGEVILPTKFSPIKLQREYVDNMEYVDGKLSRINTPYGYYNAADSLFYAYQTDRQGNIRTVFKVSAGSSSGSNNGTSLAEAGRESSGYKLIQSNFYYPYGMLMPLSQGQNENPYKFGGKEYETRFGLNLYDFVARGYDPALGIFLRPDPKARDFTPFSVYNMSGANPITNIDITGAAWVPLFDIETHAPTGYIWYPDNLVSDENGNLLPGAYHQAIFFTDNGNFNPNSNKNLGSSTAVIYKADGTIEEIPACTHPSDASKYATVPEGTYEAKVGKHKQDSPDGYTALRMADVGCSNFSNNSIKLKTKNPSNGSYKIVGANIHKAGLKNVTSSPNSIISAGCFLISREQWDKFIAIFDSSTERDNVVCIQISRNPNVSAVNAVHSEEESPGFWQYLLYIIDNLLNK